MEPPTLPSTRHPSRQPSTGFPARPPRRQPHHRPGRPAPLVLSGVQAEVVGQAPGIRIQGTINDPYWGQWTLDASFDPDTKAVSLHLVSGPTRITMDKLRALPVIP